MKKRRWPDRCALCVLVLLSLSCQAQDSFQYRARVDTPRETDFYRIALSPEMVARSKTDLSDLRILATDGRFVPYVLKEGVVDTGSAAWLLVPAPAILQKDSSDRHSYLTLRWSETYRIDRLSLAIGYPTLYKRETRIFSEMAGGWSPIIRISIDPRDTVFRLSGVRTRGLRIDIDNADNAPLRVEGLSAWQTNIYLLTYLQAGSSYLLLTGNTKASHPQYDLGYFTDSLTRRPREIATGRGEKTITVAGGPSVQLVRAADKPGGGFVLWSILSTVLLLLIYFSVKMVGAIGTKKSPHDRV